MLNFFKFIILGLTVVVCTACQNNRTPATPTKCPEVTTETEPSTKPQVEKPVEIPQYGLLKRSEWLALDGFLQDDISAAWQAWLNSCSTLKNKAAWQRVCDAAIALNNPDKKRIIDYYQQYFDVYSTRTQSGERSGLITGYYAPILKGSKTASSQYAYPLYRKPNDLISVDLQALHPDLNVKHLIGKLEGNTLVPYLNRAQIDTKPSPLKGQELVWLDNALDAFFLQVQGSGLIQFDDGSQMHIGYASHNGHPYRSIGKALVDRGELTLEQASLQSIKDWAHQHPKQLQDLLNINPRYVFFRPLADHLPEPLGALGVALTAQRSIAIDPKFIPLGAPVFLATTYPNSDQPLKQLMIAQDTGGAIKGGVRADFYWGSGNHAGEMAGAMKQQGMIWVLLPKGYPLHQQSLSD